MTPRTEQELLDATVDLATRCRWRVFHARPAMLADGQWRTATTGHKGWPDLALARDGVLLLRELKGYDARGRLGVLSNDQRDWARDLTPIALPGSEGCPAGLALAGVPCGCNGGNPSHRAAAMQRRRGLLFDVWTPDDWDSVIVPTLTARPARRTA